MLRGLAVMCIIEGSLTVVKSCSYTVFWNVEIWNQDNEYCVPVYKIIPSVSTHKLIIIDSVKAGILLRNNGLKIRYEV